MITITINTHDNGIQDDSRRQAAYVVCARAEVHAAVDARWPFFVSVSVGSDAAVDARRLRSTRIYDVFTMLIMICSETYIHVYHLTQTFMLSGTCLSLATDIHVDICRLLCTGDVQV